MDLSAVRADIAALLDDPDHDDGSWAPLFIRFSWHCSGTWDRFKGNGGSNGGTMRFKAEQEDPENAGLTKAIRRLAPVVAKHSSYLSTADIYVLAGTVAIEETGGPRISFATGRKDFTLAEAARHFGHAGGCSFATKDGGATNPHGSRLPAADLGQAKGCPMNVPSMVKEKPTIDGEWSAFF